MATAEKTTHSVEKTVTVEEERFTLTLSKDEAETLRSILTCIGGDRDRSRRKYTLAIYHALAEADVAWLSDDGIDAARGDGIFFKTETDAPLAVGDRVRITAGVRIGHSGKLTHIDEDDTELPYHVLIDGWLHGRWVPAVERI